MARLDPVSLGAGGIGLPPVLRLDEVQGHDGPSTRGPLQGRVIGDTRISLEPDNLSHAVSGAVAPGLSERSPAGETSKSRLNVNIMSMLFIDT